MLPSLVALQTQLITDFLRSINRALCAAVVAHKDGLSGEQVHGHLERVGERSLGILGQAGLMARNQQARVLDQAIVLICEADSLGFVLRKVHVGLVL